MVAEMPPIEKRTSAGTPAAMNTTCFQSTSRGIPSVGEAIFITHPLAIALPRARPRQSLRLTGKR
jgi:hypothetical protein